MEKPVYSNAFSAVQNEHCTEVVIHFLHEFPKARKVVNELGEEVLEINKENECVGAVVMTRDSLINLRDMLNKITDETTQNKTP